MNTSQNTQVKVSRNFNPLLFGEGKYAVNPSTFGSLDSYKAADSVTLVKVQKKSTHQLGTSEEAFGCWAVLVGILSDIPKPETARRLDFHHSGYFRDEETAVRIDEMGAVWLDGDGMFYATAEEVEAIVGKQELAEV